MRMLKLILVMVVFFNFNMGKIAFAENNGISIFFTNGMFNNPGKANRSRVALENKLKPYLPADTDVRFFLSYNHNEEANLQLMEVVSQKVMENWNSFFMMLSGTRLAPDWLFYSMQNLAAGMNAINYVSDGDLQLHIERYNDEIILKRKVIVVSHSQGNFYANAAYNLFDSDDFSVVAVATPSSFVAGMGKYTTLTDDAIINAVRDAFPLTLPANVTNDIDELDGNAHAFESYLDGNVSGSQIVSHVLDEIDYSSSTYVDTYGDADGDGYREGLGDCDDSDYWINPDAEEVCDEIDNNCDGFVDEVCIPNAPTNLVVVPLNSHKLEVKWVDNSWNEDGFEIKIFIPTSTGNEEITAFVDNSPVLIILPLSGNWWEIWVRAYNTNGFSSWISASGVSPFE